MVTLQPLATCVVFAQCVVSSGYRRHSFETSAIRLNHIKWWLLYQFHMSQPLCHMSPTVLVQCIIALGWSSACSPMDGRLLLKSLMSLKYMCAHQRAAILPQREMHSPVLKGRNPFRCLLESEISPSPCVPPPLAPSFLLVYLCFLSFALMQPPRLIWKVFGFLPSTF